MGLCNNWSAYGVINDEPTLMKLDDKGHVCAKTVLVTEDNGNKVYIPVVAFNKKAHVLCTLAHRGSGIAAKGAIVSETQITSNQGKTLVGILFKITDFEVLKKEPLKIEDIDFVNVVRLYEPSSFMEERTKEDDK